MLFSQIVSAEVSINNPKDAKYNLGMDIDTSVSITPNADISGLFKVSIKCQETELTYFVKPVSLKKGEQTILTIPTLRTFEGLNNTCKLKVVVENYKGVLLESESTGNFEITNSLILTLQTQKLMFNPQEEVIISASIDDIKGNKVSSGKVEVTFSGNKADFDFSNGEFTKKIILQKDISSGEHIVGIEIQDEYENYATESIKFSVTQIPTSIKNQMDKNELEPEESLKVISTLYDQAGDEMSSGGKISVYDNKERKLIEQEISTNEEFQFNLEKYSEPGEYKVKTQMQSIEKETIFRVIEVREISTELIDDTVLIINIGNIKYEGEVIIEFAEKENIIRLSLNPGESKKINLNSGEGGVMLIAEGEERNLGQADVPKKGIFSSITGMAVSVGTGKTFKKLSYILIVVVVICLIYWFLKKTKKRIKTAGYQKRREKDVEEGKNRLKNIMEDRKKNRRGMGNLFPFATKIKEEDAKDFRENMLRSIQQDTERKGKGIFTKKDIKKFNDSDFRADGGGYRYVASDKKQQTPPSRVYSSSQDEKSQEKKGFFSMFD